MWVLVAMGKEVLKTVVVLASILVAAGLIFQLHSTSVIISSHTTLCECSKNKSPLSITAQSKHGGGRGDRRGGGGGDRGDRRGGGGGARLLSYQPPGNGWNNQRIALENALVLAKLLNRTLMVQPLAPHQLGNQLKKTYLHGYLAYNRISTADLLPPSRFLDLKLLSKVVPVKEVTLSHPQFVAEYSHMTWRNICHTPGYGFWVDRLPETELEVELMTRQRFSSLGRVWREKCAGEQERAGLGDLTGSRPPMVRYVSDLEDDSSDIIYFEHGTLFGIHIRFTTLERAGAAQSWVVNHVHYNQRIWETVTRVKHTLGMRYNAIQVRRKDHRDRKLPPSYWIERMIAKNFSKELPVYVATNEAVEEWFRPFLMQGFKLHFSKNFKELSFPSVQESLRNDLLGIHEQCLCEDAGEFVGSPSSTFNAFILRQRGEVKWKGELMMDTLHTYWIGHQVKNKSTAISQPD